MELTVKKPSRPLKMERYYLASAGSAVPKYETDEIDSTLINDELLQDVDFK